MALVTLVGEKLARKGNVFVFINTLNDCRECTLRNVCFNLEAGCRYEVVDTRDKKHDCNIHEEGVRVVEVKKIAFPIAIDTKFAIAGSMLNCPSNSCINRGCEFYKLCMPYNVNSDMKLKIAEVKSKLECPLGKDVTEVWVE